MRHEKESTGPARVPTRSDHLCALFLSLAATLALMGAGRVPANAADNACKEITGLAMSSCKAEAEGTRLLTEARCANIADAAAEKMCKHQAEVAAKDEEKTCKEQRVLRKRVCARLGPGAYSPAIDPANFSSSTTIDNPFFALIPGKTFIYEGQTTEGFEHVEFAVTHATRVILGVTCIEVHDTRKIGGIVTEDTRDWFAQDKDGNVWYFGENTTLVDNGLPIDLSGTLTAWIALDQPGIIMKAHPALKDFYRQEFFVGEAEDLAEVINLSASESTPYTS